MKNILITIYKGEHEPSFNIEKHRHSCGEIVYYINGSGVTFIGNDSYPFAANTFCINNQGNKHWEKYNETTDLFFILYNRQNFDLDFKSGIYSDTQNMVIQNLFRKLWKEFRDRKENYKLKMDIITLEILIEIGRITNIQTKAQLDFIYIKQFIDENFNMKIDLNLLANMTGYSYDRFRHVFKEEYGMPVTEYLQNVRISNSAKMLKLSNLSVTEISNRCGFSSTSQFIQIFKVSEGITPYQYKKLNQKN